MKEQAEVWRDFFYMAKTFYTCTRLRFYFSLERISLPPPASLCASADELVQLRRQPLHQCRVILIVQRL